jgi:hypothetical protein
LIFLKKAIICNPFLSGIWGFINDEIPVKSIVSGERIVKTLAPFEFEMKGLCA